jgi:deoxyribose-phosphate aldolase
MDKIEICRYLDHAVLKPEMTRDEAAAAIRMGVQYNVRTVCVRPCDIALAQELCRSSQTDVCCVLGFPHGSILPASKADEAKRYVDLGVAEVDMVANYGWVRSGLWTQVQEDIEAVSRVTGSAGVALKVIFETAMLTLDQVAKTTEICVAAGAQFVKTSTGFNGDGATEDGVRTMLRTAKGRIAVKASGGIRDAARAKLFIEIGCQRLGVGYSSTPAICGSAAKGAADAGKY